MYSLEGLWWWVGWKVSTAKSSRLGGLRRKLNKFIRKNLA
jgi:hypothetical protein